MKFKKRILFVLIICYSITINAQNFQGRAIYLSKQDMNKSVKFDDSKMSQEKKDKIAAVLKKMSEKTFILNFNKTESTYKQEQTMDASGNSGMYDSDVKYKNIQNQTRIFESDIMMKPFLIVDKLEKIDWKLDDTSKKIGVYTCYKATLRIPVSKQDLEDYKREKKYAEKSKTNFLKPEVPKEQIVTAWYAPEIAVAHGPGQYWGLPGLILEINDGISTVLCTKVIINPKDKFIIKKPTSGKVVTQKQYDIIEQNKMNSLRDKNGNITIDASAN